MCLILPFKCNSYQRTDLPISEHTDMTSDRRDMKENSRDPIKVGTKTND